MKPDITVIVPMYNVENYVKKCLTSLRDQTFTNFEVWAINDGSKDRSSEYAKEYAKKDERIKVIDKPNGGYGSVLELAINNIKSDYFLICDPDDWLKDDCLSTLYHYAQKDKLDIVVGDRYDVYTDEGMSASIQKVKPTKIKEINPYTVYSNATEIQLFSFFEVSPHAKLYKTKMVKKLKFPSKVSYTDFFLYMSALAHAKRIEYINKPLAYYLRDRPGNTATDVRKSIIKDYAIVWKATFKEINTISNNDILLYRLYVQIRLILNEYKRVEQHSKFKDEYWNYIMKITKEFQKAKIKKIPPFENSFIKKCFYTLFTNKYMYQSTAKIYVLLKRNN